MYAIFGTDSTSETLSDVESKVDQVEHIVPYLSWHILSLLGFYRTTPGLSIVK